MNRLFLNRTYLIGPMDRVPDLGVEWRQDITPFLQSMGVLVLDPTDKKLIDDDNSLETPEAREECRRLLENEEYDKVAERSPIRETDLRYVDVSDFLICNLDLDKYPCGTWEESFISNTQKKPLIIRCPQGKKNMPQWMFYTYKRAHRMWFNEWSEVKEYLRHINEDSEIDKLERWKFIDYKTLANDTSKEYNIIRESYYKYVKFPIGGEKPWPPIRGV